MSGTYGFAGEGLSSSITITSLPPITGSVSITNFPSVQHVIVDSGSLSIANFPATQPISGSVSVSNFPATQPISGTVAVSSLPAISGTVAVSNFPATQPISGSVSVSNFPATQAVTQSGAWTTGRTWSLASGTDSIAAVQSGTWNITNISGTVSLPTGASTAANQTTANSSLSSIDSKTPALGQTTMAASQPVAIASNQSSIPVTVGNFPATQPISGSVSVSNFPATQPVSGTVAVSSLPAITGTVSVSNFPATQTIAGTVTANQGTAALPSNAWYMRITDGATTVGINGFSLNTNVTNTSIAITAASLPLPTGASTSALQTSGNSSLSSIDTKTPALGQAVMASSTPVVIASNQSSLPVTVGNFPATQPVSGSVSVSNFPATQAVTQSGTWTTGRTWTLASGTDSVAAVQSGTWNVTNISGTVSLPTGASTAANQTTANTSLASIDTKLTAPLTIKNSSGTATNATVAVTTASTQILAANANRKGFVVTNVGGNTVYLAFGAAASTTGYAASIATTAGSDRYEQLSMVYTGVINAIRSSGSTNVVVWEFT